MNDLRIPGGQVGNLPHSPAAHAERGTVLGALIRHFFGRFFDNEFVAQNTEIQVTVTKMLALLASPGIILPFLRYTTYLGLDRMPREMRYPMLWSDRCLYLSFSMLVM